MRKIIVLLTTIGFGFFTYAQTGEEGNIKKAIQAKIDAYQSRNLDAWKASWQHDSKISNTVTTNDFYTTVKGWDSLEATMERDIKQNPKPDNSFKMSLDNFSVHTEGNLAFVEYDAVATPESDQSSIFPYSGALHYHDYEMMVKENGQWKTRTRVVTLPESYAINNHAAETDLNAAGYDLLGSNKINEAVEIFRMNVKLFPDSWNTYDSLGEALALAGNKKEAIENYEKSVQLNPKSDGGIAALAKLKQK